MSKTETAVAPAMTPEQWRWFGEYDTWTFINSACEPGHSRAPEVAGDKLDHALAAIALHGRPYGFTREGYRAIRAMLDHADRLLASRMHDHIEYGLLQQARAEADKIAALLPPDDPK